MNRVAGVGGFFIWLNFFQWMRFFKPTAHFIRMIVATVADIGYFLIIQAIALAAFGFTLMFVNYDKVIGTPEEELEEVSLYA